MILSRLFSWRAHIKASQRNETSVEIIRDSAFVIFSPFYSFFFLYKYFILRYEKIKQMRQKWHRTVLMGSKPVTHFSLSQVCPSNERDNSTFIKSSAVTAYGINGPRNHFNGENFHLPSRVLLHINRVFLKNTSFFFVFYL